MCGLQGVPCNFLSDNLFVTSDSFAGLSVETVSTVDRVVEELRRALFEGEIEPGTPLREVALAESLGVSRATVREALAVLIAEGLADRIPNKGTQVRTLTPEDVIDVSRAREALELAGISRWKEASEESRVAVREALAEFDRLARRRSTAVELTAAHLAIHRSLTGLTESPRLIAMSEALYDEIRLALASVDRARRNAREQVHTHGALVELLERGQVAAARRELRHHLEGATESMIGSLGLRA